jgi:hypothetical protein
LSAVMASRRDVSESTSRSARLLGRGRAIVLSSFPYRGLLEVLNSPDLFEM